MDRLRAETIPGLRTSVAQNVRCSELTAQKVLFFVLFFNLILAMVVMFEWPKATNAAK